MTELAHIVFYVRDLERSLVFLRDVVGLEVAGTIFNGHVALLSGGRTHHELLLIEVGEAPGPLRGRRVGERISENIGYYYNLNPASSLRFRSRRPIGTE
jgi:catechol 2,3-dioxygenase-like lactoylglutathione lyase family enzyme